MSVPLKGKSSGDGSKMETLESQLKREFNDLDIEEKNRFSIVCLLNIIRLKDEATYMHSLRCGILGARVAKSVPAILEPKALFYPGLLHDVGKIMIDSDILKKKEGFNEEDMRQMRAHSLYSYQILRGIHEFSAHVALRHHRHQPNFYPEQLPEFPKSYSQATKLLVDNYARYVSDIDSYDAASTRANNKFGEECRYQTPEEVRAFMFKNNPDQKRFLEHLYKEGIFGKRDESPSNPEELPSALDIVDALALPILKRRHDDKTIQK